MRFGIITLFFSAQRIYAAFSNAPNFELRMKFWYVAFQPFLSFVKIKATEITYRKSFLVIEHEEQGYRR